MWSESIRVLNPYEAVKSAETQPDRIPARPASHKHNPIALLKSKLNILALKD